MTEKLKKPDFDFIRDMVKKKSAIIIEENKAYLVEAKLSLLIKQLKLNTFTDLINQVRLEPAGACAQAIISAMTINETSFFRDIHPFEAMRKEIIPDLIKKREKEKCINIWCGASSTGQEPYTLAIMLHEYFPDIVKNWKVSIIATDIADDILKRARTGIYSQLEVNRGLPVTMLVKYFQKTGVEWQVKDDVKKIVDFRLMNLFDNWQMLPKMDVIFIRNVLIYFEVDVKKQILEKAHRILQPDGYLFLGATETTFNITNYFERIEIAGSFCYRPLKITGE